MTKISDKSADNQSEARISVAYNKYCHLSLMTSFVKCPPDLHRGFTIIDAWHRHFIVSCYSVPRGN